MFHNNLDVFSWVMDLPLTNLSPAPEMHPLPPISLCRHHWPQCTKSTQNKGYKALTFGRKKIWLSCKNRILYLIRHLWDEPEQKPKARASFPVSDLINTILNKWAKNPRNSLLKSFSKTLNPWCNSCKRRGELWTWNGISLKFLS